VTVRFAVFASGSGTNLQALLDREHQGASYRIALLITDRPCLAEDRAKARGCTVHRVDFEAGVGIAGQEAVAATIFALLEGYQIRGILLAGFLRLMPAEVCRLYRKRMLNVHPALLPSFGGKGMYGARVHEAVISSGATLSGPTVHFVNERYDEGRILAQWPVPVYPNDTPEHLAARVLEVEHILFPASTEALAGALRRGWPVERAEPPSFRPGFAWLGKSLERGELRRAIAFGFGDARA